MIAELLATLAGHPSSLFSSSFSSSSPTLRARDDIPFLHPAEIEILNKLATYSTRYTRIKSYAQAELDSARRRAVRNAVHSNSLSSKAITEQGEEKTTHLIPLCSTLLDLLKGYHHLVLKTERDILANDSELVAEKGFVSLANIRARLEEWDAPLTALDELVTSLLGGQKWTGGLLIDLLSHKATTGVHQVGLYMSQLHDAVHQSWLVGLEAWVCNGQVLGEALVEWSQQTDQDWFGTTGSWQFRQDALPKSLSEGTADSILYIGRAIHTVRSSSSATPPEEMRAKHSNLLRSSRSLERTISEIRTSISSWLFATVLTTDSVLEALEILSSYLLHRDGTFSLSLLDSVETMRKTKLFGARNASAGLIRSSDMDLALYRSCPEDDPSLSHLRFITPKIAGPFDEILIGLPFQLHFTASFPLDLFLTTSDLIGYSTLFSYLIALKKTQSRVLGCWMSLSKSQRVRRRFTGTGEGGMDEAEEGQRMDLLRKSWGLARDMLWFLDTILGHFQTDVIDVQYTKLLEAKDIFSLRANHTTFLDSITEDVLLSWPDATTIISEILTISSRFAGLVERWGGDVLPSLLSSSPSQNRHSEITTLSTSLRKHLCDFFSLLSTGKHTQLLLRLDFNDYLSSVQS